MQCFLSTGQSPTRHGTAFSVSEGSMQKVGGCISNVKAEMWKALVVDDHRPDYPKGQRVLVWAPRAGSSARHGYRFPLLRGGRSNSACPIRRLSMTEEILEEVCSKADDDIMRAPLRRMNALCVREKTPA